MKSKIGQLLLSYGAPREAADVFRNMVQTDDRDADAYAGLGEADLAMENYQDARNAFQKALQLNPADQAIKTQLDLSDRVLTLDPNARGLRAAEVTTGAKNCSRPKSRASINASLAAKRRGRRIRRPRRAQR